MPDKGIWPVLALELYRDLFRTLGKLRRRNTRVVLIIKIRVEHFFAAMHGQRLDGRHFWATEGAQTILIEK